MPAWIYILRLNSGGLYIGSTAELKRRYAEHRSGNACRTTKLDPPEKLVHSESFPDLASARKREQQLKRWTRAKKEALICGNKNALRSLSKSRKKSEITHFQKETLELGEDSALSAFAEKRERTFTKARALKHNRI
jgi:putative endonuclease